MTARQDVTEVISSTETDAATKAQLELSQEILSFAVEHMSMSVGKRYRKYVALDQPYVVWNVFAAKNNSTEGYTWCYPVVGCAPYRGFFAQADAEQLARSLAEEGLQTYLGGVPAYSTLGWFDDPLLSTFLHWPEPDLVNLLLHELAHGEVWAESDVVFNESLASFVADEGLAQWASAHERSFPGYHLRQKEWQRFQGLLLRLKHALQTDYEAGGDGERIYQAFRQCYNEARPSLGNGRFDELVEERLNNAYLVSVATYADLKPAFAELYRRENQNWSEFFRAANALADLAQEERDLAVSRLSPLASSPSAEHGIDGKGDNQSTEQVQCQALSSHSR